MGKLDGKVAFITGGARGQGASHALALAAEGADIITLDICDAISESKVQYPLATPADLAETVRGVEALGRRIVARQADVRDFEAVQQVVQEGVAELGRVDIVCANAGIFVLGQPAHEVSGDDWDAVIDVNLKGVWHTVKAVVPHLVDQGTGGSIVLTSSTAGVRGSANTVAYTASKHGVIGLMKTFAHELAPHGVRVNAVLPTSVGNDMVLNEATYRLFLPDQEHPTLDDAKPGFRSIHLLDIPFVENSDISNAVLFLASEDSRYVTGLELRVDAGCGIK